MKHIPVIVLFGTGGLLFSSLVLSASGLQPIVFTAPLLAVLPAWRYLRGRKAGLLATLDDLDSEIGPRKPVKPLKPRPLAAAALFVTALVVSAVIVKSGPPSPTTMAIIVAMIVVTPCLMIMEIVRAIIMRFRRA